MAPVAATGISGGTGTIHASARSVLPTDTVASVRRRKVGVASKLKLLSETLRLAVWAPSGRPLGVLWEAAWEARYVRNSSRLKELTGHQQGARKHAKPASDGDDDEHSLGRDMWLTCATPIFADAPHPPSPHEAQTSNRQIVDT